jgi:chloramphenicol 3-O phosphotransferase
METHGKIVILNGAPRSGKSSIARIIQDTFEGPWMNLGVDAWVREVTPPRYRPGIGLRPGGERPDLEAHIPASWFALYDSMAAHSRLGLNVVADVGHHDAYSRPLNLLPRCARRLSGFSVMFVGVKCSIETIMARRNQGQPGREAVYVRGSADEPVPSPVAAWQREVHRPGIYDLEIDTSLASPEECAAAIRTRLYAGEPAFDAFTRLATFDS